MNIPTDFKCLWALYESELHDLICFMRGINPDIRENMNYYKTIQEAYKEAILVEHLLKWSRMRHIKS